MLTGRTGVFNALMPIRKLLLLNSIVPLLVHEFSVLPMPKVRTINNTKKHNIKLNLIYLGNLFVVNGPDFTDHEISGYVIDVKTAKVASKFNVNIPNQGLSNPHDLSVTNDATEIFVAELDSRLVKFVYTNGTNKVIRKNVESPDDAGIQHIIHRRQPSINDVR